MNDAQMIARHGIAAQFKVHVRCENCAMDGVRMLSVPRVDGAPVDIDELLESEFLSRQRFTCRQCDGAIANLVAVKTVAVIEAA